MLVILLHPRVDWTGADWGALALILVGAVVYTALFSTLSAILISSRHHSSASLRS